MLKSLLKQFTVLLTQSTYQKSLSESFLNAYSPTEFLRLMSWIVFPFDFPTSFNLLKQILND
jgi:hypothetical protein